MKASYYIIIIGALLAIIWQQYDAKRQLVVERAVIEQHVKNYREALKK